MDQHVAESLENLVWSSSGFASSKLSPNSGKGIIFSITTRPSLPLPFLLSPPFFPPFLGPIV